MADNLVIVESPAKAKTIKKYLGRDFEVLASYGHVRDLVPKEGAVDPDDGFRMKYQLLDKNERHVEAIARALHKAKALYLATDPDREGEAIAWHLKEILQARGDLDGKDVHRGVFYDITRNAIRAAVRRAARSAPCGRSTASRAAASRARRSPPRRCSRRRPASSASMPGAPCVSRSSCTRARIWAKAASASSPTGAPTRCQSPPKRWARYAQWPRGFTVSRRSRRSRASTRPSRRMHRRRTRPAAPPRRRSRRRRWRAGSRMTSPASTP